MNEWWARLADSFGSDQFPIVQMVYHELIRQFGIYYYDLKPGNISFE